MEERLPMKTAITGKGGTGKTTVAGIAHQFPNEIMLGAIPLDQSIQNADFPGISLVESMSTEVKAEFQRIYQTRLAPV
jgi:CO dehydrogenase nickel-insertion accessory protein CooC1